MGIRPRDSFYETAVLILLIWQLFKVVIEESCGAKGPRPGIVPEANCRCLALNQVLQLRVAG